MSLPLPEYCGKAANTLEYLAAFWDPCSRTHAAAMPGRCYDLIYLGPPPLAWFPSAVGVFGLYPRTCASPVGAWLHCLRVLTTLELLSSWSHGQPGTSPVQPL